MITLIILLVWVGCGYLGYYQICLEEEMPFSFPDWTVFVGISLLGPMVFLLNGDD